jgi:hypothetical protein
MALAAGPSLAKNGADDPAGDDNGGNTNAGNTNGGNTNGGGNATRVIKRGDCSGRSNWKLKVKPDNGKLETEFEVDQNKSGVLWKVRLRRDGKTVATGTRRTHRPSGSFSFERRIANPAGTNRISAVAKRHNGEVCRGSLRI